MKDFILGIAVGALGAYAALKLSDDGIRADLEDKFDEMKEKAMDGLDTGKVSAKMRSLRAGVVARQEYRKGMKTFNEKAAEVAGKLIDVLEDLETKAKANVASSK